MLNAAQLYNHYEISEVYCQLGSHVKSSLRANIEKGRVVELERLLKKKRMPSQDEKIQIINRGGQMFYLPAADKETSIAINCYDRCEEAFRIYAGIYTKANPEHAVEIFQYIDDIKGAAQDNTWESVYEYDMIFRDIMDTFPMRNWGIIF